MNEETNTRKLWFRAKRYGWGWQPATWQGLVATFIYLIALFLEFIRIDIFSHSASDTFLGFTLPFILITALFLMLCYGTGEKPRWRWGGKSTPTDSTK